MQGLHRLSRLGGGVVAMVATGALLTTGPLPASPVTLGSVPAAADWVPEQPELFARVNSAGQTVVPVGRGSIRLPILMYHYIRTNPNPKDATGADLSVTLASFRDQMQWLGDHGYHPIDFNDLRAYLRGQAPLPARPVIITLDDGYADLYSAAYPVLRQHGFKAVAYIVSGFVGSPSTVTRDQILEMDHHRIEIASHTVSHKELPGLPRPVLMHELVDSKADLEHLTGHPILDFCYPVGRNSPAVVQAVAEAGYDTATTTAAGIQHSPGDRFLWTRVRVHGGEDIHGFASSLGSEEPTVPGATKSPPRQDPLAPFRDRRAGGSV